MKSILLSVVLFFACINCHAQHLELGLNGGAGINTPITRSAWEPYFLTAPNLVVSPVVSFKAMVACRHWQFGIDVEQRKASYKTERRYLGDPMISGFMFYNNIEPITVNYYPVRLFANRKMRIGRFDVYGGLSASYICTANKDGKYLKREAFMFHQGADYGRSAGAQAGGTYFITKRLGVNAEFAADFISFYPKYWPLRMQVYSLTTGIRFRV